MKASAFLRSLCALPAALLLLGLPAAGASFTWTGATTQTLDDGTNTNWLGGTAPPNDGTALLLFGVPASPQAANVMLSGSFSVDSIAFSGSYPKYFFSTLSGLPPVLGLGAGGITLPAGGAGGVAFDSKIGLQLNSAQTWTADGNLYVASALSGSAALTKAGTGLLVLDGANTAFSGTITVTQGKLYLGNPDAAGTGTLILQSGTTLAAAHDSVAIGNSVTVSDNVTFAHATGPFIAHPSIPDLKFTGPVTAATNSVRLHVLDKITLWLSGGLDGPASTSITVDSSGVIVLTGATSSAITNLTADGASLVFAAPGALPAAGSTIQALNNGYISVGATSTVPANVPLPSTVLGLITNKAAFNGTFGFDTDPALGSVYTYTEPLDFSAFSPTTFKIGSSSTAVLGPAATITPPTGGNYRFGDGGGRLVVQSNLTAPVSVFVDSLQQRPLTLVLQGNNTFTGDLWSVRSYVVLDSSSALPTGANKIHLGQSGYISYTPNWGAAPAPADLISRLSPGYDPTGILGFDSAQPATLPLTVAGNIDLSSLSGPLYLGTTTQSTTLTGTITPPAGGVLQLAGVNGGFLKVASALTAANGVTSVVVGHPDQFRNNGPEGVSLDGTNTYTGGTTLLAGALYLGNNSALGTGALTIDVNAINAGIVPSANVALTNPIVANNPEVKIGSPSNSIVFNGTISGAARLDLGGNLTLGVANTYTGGTLIDSGALPVTINVGNDTAFGAGAVNLAGSYATVNFTTATPSIGSLSGVTSIAGGFVLPVNATSLTINQTTDGTFAAPIAGPSSSTTNAALIKNGPAQLTLSATNNYTGGTQLNGGSLAAGTSGALGTSTITIINGAKLITQTSDVVLTNPISFGPGGGKLGGSGTFSPPGGLTIGSTILLTPGNGGVSTLNFGTNLTWDAGGTFKIGLQDPNGLAGSGTDQIFVNGTINITATSGSPFTLSLWTLDPAGNQGVPMAGFNPGQTYNWQIAGASGGITNFNASSFTIDPANFANSLGGGSLSLALGGAGGNTALYLNFTPVPEPSTWALLVGGAGAVLFPALRRRRK